MATDPKRDPARPSPIPLRKPHSLPGRPSSLGEATGQWWSRRGRLLQRAPRPVTCERCRDTGVVDYTLEQGNVYCACPAGRAEDAKVTRWYDEMHAEEMAWRRQVLEERLAAFSARVLPQGQAATLETLHPSPALARLRAFAAHWTGEQGMFLTGPVGVGKTTLLVALVRSLAETFLTRKLAVRLVTAPDFLCDLRAGFDPTRQAIGEGYAAMLEQYQKCGVLVFDDLGAEKLTDWVEEQFYLLIDHRYRQRLPLFASSNFSTAALAQRLDRRVLDRLRETCVMIEVVGPNLRDQVVQRGQPGGGEPR